MRLSNMLVAYGSVILLALAFAPKQQVDALWTKNHKNNDAAASPKKLMDQLVASKAKETGNDRENTTLRLQAVTPSGSGTPGAPNATESDPLPSSLMAIAARGGNKHGAFIAAELKREQEYEKKVHEQMPVDPEFIATKATADTKKAMSERKQLRHKGVEYTNREPVLEQLRRGATRATAPTVAYTPGMMSLSEEGSAMIEIGSGAVADSEGGESTAAVGSSSSSSKSNVAKRGKAHKKAKKSHKAKSKKTKKTKTVLTRKHANKHKKKKMKKKKASTPSYAQLMKEEDQREEKVQEEVTQMAEEAAAEQAREDEAEQAAEDGTPIQAGEESAADDKREEEKIYANTNTQAQATPGEPTPAPGPSLLQVNSGARGIVDLESIMEDIEQEEAKEAAEQTEGDSEKRKAEGLEEKEEQEDMEQKDEHYMDTHEDGDVVAPAEIAHSEAIQADKEADEGDSMDPTKENNAANGANEGHKGYYTDEDYEATDDNH